MAAALHALAQFRGREAESGSSADGLIWALAVRAGAGVSVLAANLDRRPRRAELHIAGRRVTRDIPAGAWRRLDLEQEQ